MMDYVFSMVTLLLGGFISVMNWLIGINNARGGKYSSPVIFFAGILLAVGLANCPFEPLQKWWWVAFFVDYGSLPIIIHALILKIKK